MLMSSRVSLKDAPQKLIILRKSVEGGEKVKKLPKITTPHYDIKRE